MQVPETLQEEEIRAHRETPGPCGEKIVQGHSWNETRRPFLSRGEGSGESKPTDTGSDFRPPELWEH